MAIDLLPDEPWNEIEPPLPLYPPQPKGGRPCLLGILFVLRMGMAWQMIPTEMGCASGSTCRRRWRDWTAAGVWPEVNKRLLNGLGKQDEIDWSRTIIDSAPVRDALASAIPDQAPQIEPRTGATATCSPTPRACRWSFGPPRPTCVTSNRPPTCSRASHRFKGFGVGADPNPRYFRGTAGTAFLGSSWPWRPGTSSVCWRSVGLSMEAGWGRPTASSSGPWCGLATTADSRSATSRQANISRPSTI